MVASVAADHRNEIVHVALASTPLHKQRSRFHGSFIHKSPSPSFFVKSS